MNSRRAAVLGLLGIPAAMVTLAALARSCPRVEVRGESMTPLLEPGDRLLAVPGRLLRPDQIVVVRDPRQPARLLVKRIAAVDGDRVTLVGDNPAASTDSRHWGAVPRRSVRGRVVYRYGPPARSGRL